MRRARQPDDEQAARAYALRLLGRRSHATVELSRKLSLRGYEPAAVTAAVERLRSAGLLDDERFAASFMRYALAGKAQGRRLLEAKLKAHGVERTLAAAVVQGALTDEDEMRLATEAAGKFLARAARKPARGPRTGPARLTPQAIQQYRLAGYLARRGFGYDIVHRVVKRSRGAVNDGE